MSSAKSFPKDMSSALCRRQPLVGNHIHDSFLDARVRPTHFPVLSFVSKYTTQSSSSPRTLCALRRGHVLFAEDIVPSQRHVLFAGGHVHVAQFEGKPPDSNHVNKTSFPDAPILGSHSCGSDQDAEYALSKLLQFGTVDDYQREFEKLMNRVTDIPESLLISYLFSGLKLHLQHQFFVSRPTTLGDAFSLAHITEARYEDERSTTAIAKPTSPILTIAADTVAKIEKAVEFYTSELKEHGTKPENRKSNGVMSVLKDDSGEFDDDLDEINLGLSEEFMIRMLEGRVVFDEKSREVFSVTPWAAKGERMLS
ncbi:hypothetical protein Tco_1355371 [Tanacetum coccineum]